MAKLKLLVAEDSKSMQAFYKLKLPDVMFEKKIVSDGEQAIKEYADWQPDIVLLDINMPLMNGYQALKSIREEHRDKITTIIMVTSTSEKSEILACAKLGIQGYIVKPFSAEELPVAIMKYHRGK